MLFRSRNRLLPFTLCAAAACATKEQVGLVVAMLGLWYAVAHGRRGAGAVIAAAGVAVAVVATTVVVPHFAPGDGSPFEGRYAAVGGTPGGIARTVAGDPGTILAAVSEPRDLHYVLDLLVPLGGLPLLSPLLAASTLPELALNLLSSTRTQTSIHFHYTAAAIPGLMMAAVLGAARLRRRAPSAFPWIARGAVLTVLLAGVVLGPLPLWGHIPGGSTLGAHDHVVSAHDRAAERVLHAVPPDVPVSATNTTNIMLRPARIMPRMSRRQTNQAVPTATA